MAAGETRRYGSSGTLLAAQENRKIVPVAHNAGYFWPRRGVLKRRGTIRVIIGPPIDPVGPRCARGERRSADVDREPRRSRHDSAGFETEREKKGRV